MSDEAVTILRDLVDRLGRVEELLEGLTAAPAPAGRTPRGRRSAADVRAESRARETEARELRQRVGAWLERALPELADDTFAIAAGLELARVGELSHGPLETRRRYVLERRESLMARATPHAAEELASP